MTSPNFLSDAFTPFTILPIVPMYSAKHVAPIIIEIKVAIISSGSAGASPIYKRKILIKEN
jgi:hypothetical protein